MKMDHGRMRMLALAVVSASVISGCAVSTDKTVAVSKPMTTVREVIEGKPEQVEVVKAPAYIAVLPFVNSTSEPRASELMRSTLHNHFSSKNFRMMNWRDVDQKLSYVDDPAAIDPVQAIQNLGVEGVLVGTVTDFEMLHAGIVAQIKLAVDLKLIDRNGDTLWKKTHEVTSRAGGVSTTPWGLLLNAAVATMHLNEANLLAAADELGREIAAVIPEPIGYQGTAGPMVSQFLHDGAGRLMNYGDTVKLGLRGAPGMRASAVLEGVTTIDLPEVEAGVYIAEVPVSKEWNATGVMASGRLTDSEGNATTWISPTGLLTFDNIAPQAVSALSIHTGQQQSSASWQATDADAVAFRVSRVDGDQRELLGETRETSLTLGDLPLFERVRLEVEALDAAGNASTAAVLATRLYPVAGVERATVLHSDIDVSHTGDLLLSAERSPYVLRDALHIAPGEALFVEPGVELQIGAGGSLKIEGDAWFWGQDKGIRVTPLQGRSPAQYMSLASKGNVSLDNVTFEKGQIALNITAGSPQLNNVVMQGSDYSAMSISGSAAPVCDRCVIDGSNTAGVVVEGYAKPIFKQSEFRHNRPFHIQSSSVYPVVAEGNSWEPAASERTVLGEVRY